MPVDKSRRLNHSRGRSRAEPTMTIDVILQAVAVLLLGIDLLLGLGGHK
ncbi:MULTISPECIES: hypothetical protein [Natrinema]|uniref:Uncharacterized protein n=1 Tax=Natrinema hispanicum TaxID=392421 RepID=A0A1G6YGX2_9EURY|nr:MULTISPECIES: hypothetical protein [Natrinema]SDD89243.1 hypothetical protein SAMN05192552_10662 [Natrinema hispanicum]